MSRKDRKRRTNYSQPKSSADDAWSIELHSLLALNATRTKQDYERIAAVSEKSPAANHQSGAPLSERDVAELDVLLAEYDSLRQESLNTISNRIQTMVLGLTAISALMGGALATNQLTANKSILIGVFSGAVPLVSVFVILVWLSEAVRSHRVGHYLASVVEARVNAKLGRLALSWEAALWTQILPRDELFGPSMMSMGIIGVIAAISPWCGVFLSGTNIALEGRPLYEVIVPYVFLAMSALYCLLHMKRLRNIPIIRSPFHV